MPDKAFKLQGKIIDAVYLESESGAKMWILNDPTTPVILKMEDNPFGVDIELTEVK